MPKTRNVSKLKTIYANKAINNASIEIFIKRTQIICSSGENWAIKLD